MYSGFVDKLNMSQRVCKKVLRIIDNEMVNQPNDAMIEVISHQNHQDRTNFSMTCSS